MAEVIQFPKQESNSYKNIKNLLEVCGSLEVCKFYIGTAENSFEKGYLTESEFLTLQRIGRQKLDKLEELSRTIKVRAGSTEEEMKNGSDNFEPPESAITEQVEEKSNRPPMLGMSR